MNLRWDEKGHEIHANRLLEYLCLTKYYNTEQLNDALRDGIECLRYVAELQTAISVSLSKIDEATDSITVCHTNLKANAELIAKILDADSELKLYSMDVCDRGDEGVTNG